MNKRDYLALLDKLVEKYSTDEAAVIHAALLKKCQAGDMDAIRPVSYTHLDVYKRQLQARGEDIDPVALALDIAARNAAGPVAKKNIKQTQILYCLLYTSRCV